MKERIKLTNKTNIYKDKLNKTKLPHFNITQQTRQGNLPTNYKNLTIITLNVNGLFDDKKKYNNFHYLQNKRAQILLLQETHSTPDAIKKWENEWKGKSYWHSSTIKKSLLKNNPNTKTETITITKGDDGKILALTFLFEK